MNDFIQKLLDDIHNINPELSLKRQTEYNQNFVNKTLNEQCDIPIVSTRLKVGTKVYKKTKEKMGIIENKSYYGFNHWIVEWDGGEKTSEYGADLNVW